MIPFLKNRQEASASGPVEPVKRKPDHEEDYDSLHVAAEDMLTAIKSGDAKALASALKAAFQIVDSEPHEEGTHNG